MLNVCKNVYKIDLFLNNKQCFVVGKLVLHMESSEPWKVIFRLFKIEVNNMLACLQCKALFAMLTII